MGGLPHASSYDRSAGPIIRDLHHFRFGTGLAVVAAALLSYFTPRLYPFTIAPRDEVSYPQQH
jgi:hypothetical protein